MSTRKTHVANATLSAWPDGVARSTINMDTIPADIHCLIMSELADTYPADILNLAQASRTLRDAALPFMYRDITLTKGPKRSKYRAILERFRRDEYGELARHVRNITVKNEVPSEDLMVILSKISQSGNLQSLSWETSAHMSRAVFDMIHKSWPELQIRVAVADRENAKLEAHRQMDMRLLSSPLLVELAYELHSTGYRYDVPCHSDWPWLSQALAAGGNLRSLRIKSVPGSVDVVSHDEPEKLPRFDFTSGLCLSHLQVLSIQDLTYLWDAEHCRMLCSRLNCSRLRQLDFGTGNPEAFFRHFTGLLPDLKNLRFGAFEGATGCAKAFIKSLDSLKHLEIARAHDGIDDLWPAIEQHKATLKTLILGPTFGSYCSPLYIDLSRLQTIRGTFSALERLGWAAPCNANVDEKHLAVLSTIKLERLDLYMHIPDEASEYSARLTQNAMGTIAPPPLELDGSVAAAIRIAEVCSGSRKDALQCLTLHLSRTGYADRAQTWMMHAGLQVRYNKYDNTDPLHRQRWNVRGSMVWNSGVSLREELLLEEI